MSLMLCTKAIRGRWDLWHLNMPPRELWPLCERVLTPVSIGRLRGATRGRAAEYSTGPQWPRSGRWMLALHHRGHRYCWKILSLDLVSFEFGHRRMQITMVSSSAEW